MYFFSSNSILVFIVQYDPDVIHALDGLGTGLVIVPVLGNFMLRVYKTSEKQANTGGTYGSIVKAMLEIVTFMVNLQKHTVVKVSEGGYNILM
jgi:hypothetical protein